MNNIQTYKVQIIFTNKCTSIPDEITIYASYKQGNGKLDSFKFTASEIEINLIRSKNYETIISRPNNSVNTQIIKALIAYYAIADIISPIEQITMSRIVGTREYPYNESESFQQPLLVQEAIANPLHYSPSILSDVVREDEKGTALRIALSYWLKAVVVDNVYLKFENLWRAFNRLYVYQGNDRNEMENMKAIRQLMLLNSGKFPLSKEITNGYTNDEFHSFRWQKMILNDYDSIAKTEALVEFIKRYSDRRIMELFKEKLVCRESYLTAKGEWTNVQNYIARNASTTADIELVTILCIKYAYFIRNKYFHGETLDGTFKLQQDKIDIEFERESKLLMTVIHEIINGNLLRQ